MNSLSNQYRATFIPRVVRGAEATQLLLLLALVMRVVSGPTANLSYFLLAGYAMRGRVQAIQALGMSWLFTMLNPAIVAEASAGAIGRYAVLMAAAASVLMRSSPLRLQSATAMTLLLGVFLIGHSMLVSPMVDVSVLKATSWGIAMATSVSAWLGLAAHHRERVATQVFGALALVLVASLPTALIPQIGYLRNGTGFQGVLNHPQAFGPTMALLGAWAASQLLARRRPSWSSIMIFIGAVFSVVLSEARTAGLAMVLGLVSAVIVTPALSGRSIRTVLPGIRSKRFVGLMGACAVALLMAGPIASEMVSAYILSKSGRAEASSLVAAYEASRGGLMEKMLTNISNNAWEGIGFGIASDPAEMTVVRDSATGLPLSAVIEKGVLPLAVLEEVGVIGFLLVLAWIVMLLRWSAHGGVGPVAVGMTALLLNMGESTLFSPGGLGLILMLLMGWCVACGKPSGGEQ